MTATAHIRTARLLLIGASSLALAMPAAANDVIFSSSGAQPEVGQRTSQASGLTQIKLSSGAMVSISDAAEYTINADGSITLYRGAITVTGGDAGEAVVRLPEDLEARVGSASSGSFSVASDGESSGHTLTGEVVVAQPGRTARPFTKGLMWTAEPGRGPRRAIAKAAVAQPAATPQPTEVVAIGDDAGPVGAALNGIPVTLGDGLAGAGASADIVEAGRRVEAAVGNPTLQTFPTGDLALLVAAAAELENAFGGRPFNGAQADIIRTYLRFLASGGSGAEFLTAYSAFLLDYLDLIRAGGVPSGFASGVAGPAEIEAYLAFLARTGALTNLAASDRALVDAYLAFIASGANRDLFLASLTDLTQAYFAFLRSGGAPGDFTGASEAALAQSIAFLNQAGLLAQLSAADRALVEAFLANGGIAFASQYRSALDAYFAYLAAGGLPSDYTALDQATLRAYLETLAKTGLFEAVLAQQADFYADYLAFLRAGGTIDGFAGLPANIFASYAVQLNAYFAFLAAGNLPTQYDAADIAQLQAFVLQLQAAGALDRFLTADRAAFFASFSQFVAGGGNPDAFASLNANIFAGYASALAAYYDFLLAGGIPTAYAELSQEEIASFIAALEAAGATNRFLADLAAFYQDYFAFLAGGGNPDNFAGLPVPPDFPAFAAALNAYAAFLSANGLPSDYSEEDIAQLQAFFNAVLQSGQLEALLGANAQLLQAYFAFIDAGGALDGFAGLPIYLDYAAALDAYAAFLAAGGLPSDYTALDLATLEAYLAALAALPGGIAGFGDLADNAALLSAYLAFLNSGGDPNGFAGLPIYADYVAALNAYFDFLANGGLPSEYTALDLAILEAYLAALASLAGGLDGFADLADFFVDYYNFLLTGGDPDQFTGLPGNGGGGGDPDPAPRLAGATFIVNGGTLPSYQGVTLDVTPEGQITEVTLNDGTSLRFPNLGGNTNAFDERTGWEVIAAGRFGNAVAYTSYLDRNSGLGTNVVYNMIGGIPTVDIPQSGVVDYRLVGGSAPADANGVLGSQGYFTGNLAVAFGGSTPRVGIDFEVTSGSTTYGARTAGGAADPLNFGLEINSLGQFSGGIQTSVIAGEGCSVQSQCSTFIDGGLFGENASHVGFIYQLRDFSNPSARLAFNGSAVFGREGTALPGLGVPPDTGSNPTYDFLYQGGFAPVGPGLFSRSTLASTNQFGTTLDVLRNSQVATNRPASLAVAIDPDGALSRATARTTGENQLSRGSTSASDVYGDASLLIGRWSNGTYTFNVNNTSAAIGPNQSVHYLLTSGWSDPKNFPTGRVTYDLLAATSPTLLDGSLAPGVFDANLAIIFGATPNIAIDGTITLSGPNGFVYSFATEGGAQGAGLPFNITSPGGPSNLFSGGYFNFQAPGTTNDGRNGTFIAEGQIVDPQADRLGFVYEVPLANPDFQNTGTIIGAAIFGATQDTSGGGGTGGGGNTGTGFTGTRDGIVYYTYLNGSLASGFGGSADLANGELTKFTSILGTVDIGTAEAVEAGDAGTMAWARWTNGTVETRTLVGNADSVLGANGGYHVMAGTPSTSLPGGGTVNYELIGTTSATDNRGSAPGTITGDLAIAFGTISKVGFDLAMNIGGLGYSVSTAGGAANPGASQTNVVLSSGGPTFSAAFNSVIPGSVTGSGGACVSSCQVSISGALYGANASHAGVAMNVFDAGSGTPVQASGLAIFAAPGAAGTGMTRSAAAIAPSTAPTGSGDWSRWAGLGGSDPRLPANGRGSVMGALSVPGTAAVGQGAVSRDLTQAEAIERAEQLLGGTISWSGHSLPQR